MRKLAHILLGLVLLTGLTVVAVAPGYAQDPTATAQAEEAAPAEEAGEEAVAAEEVPPPTPLPQPLVVEVTPIAAPEPITDPDAQDVFTLGQLGYDTRNMTGPYDWRGYFFSPPAHWQLVEGAEIQLDTVTTLVYRATGLALDRPEFPIGYTLGGTLDVSYNGVLLASVPLRVGVQTTVVPISAEALAAAGLDGRQALTLWLDAAFECDPGVDVHTTVQVSSDSRLFLPHETKALPTDLRLLPFPIHQRSFVEDYATIVVPDQPTAEELQAALSVSAGFGQMTDGELNLSLVSYSQLTEEMRNTYHLILVGKPGGFDGLSQMDLPAPASADGFSGVTMAASDGIIQEIISPWNEGRVLLLVSGETDEGVVKAGQAVSTGTILVGDANNLAIVSQVEPLIITPDAVVVDQTLADLGYPVVQLTDTGTNYYEYNFYLRPGQNTSDESYIDFVFNHSSFLNYTQSGLTIYVNDERIGSAQFSDESINLTRARFDIPATALRVGKNYLTVEAYIIPWDVCAALNTNGLWVSVRPETLLHMPMGPAELTGLPAIYDLAQYPRPFVPYPVLLGDTAFVLDPGDWLTWSYGSQIAFELGNQANEIVSDLAVNFADNVPDEVRQERHLLVIGKPNQLPLVGELQEADALPSPIDPDTNMPMPQNDLRVDYRLPEGSSLGYLQIMPAPWNTARTVLTVLGNNDQGVEWASTALISPTLQGQLSGNLALISTDQVVPSYFPSATSLQVLVPDAEAATKGEAEMVVEEPDVQMPVISGESQVEARPSWVLPVLIISLILLVLLVVVIVILSMRSSRPSS